MWARVHKIDRIRPRPAGDAIVLVEDERNTAAMSRMPSLTALIAMARVLNARRALDAKFGGKGEVRYAVAMNTPPSFLVDAVTRAGASVCDSAGDRVIVPASPASVSSVIDNAFADVAHQLRASAQAPNIITALRAMEANRRKAPLDRDDKPQLYWVAVFELAALAGELSRPRGGRWVETTEMPVPFAVKFPDGALAMPAKLAQRIVEGDGLEESLADGAEQAPS